MVSMKTTILKTKQIIDLKYSKSQMDQWKEITAAAHQKNEKIFLQLWLEGTKKPSNHTYDEIANTIEEFYIASANAVKAGFDGVQLEINEGFLLHQFLHESSNTRLDWYGGSLKARSRFILEVVDAIGSAWEKNRVGIKLGWNARNTQTYEYLINELNRRQLAYIEKEEFKGLITEDLSKTYAMAANF